MKTSVRTNALGTKLIFTGVLEDPTFKAPFVSHRISYPLIRNSVYKFDSAYVHQSEDKSVLLVVTEHTKIEPKKIEDYREFVWTAKIESIKRPVHYIALQGIITTVHSNSGLVRRCNKCKSIVPIRKGHLPAKTRQKVSGMLVHHFVNHVWKYNTYPSKKVQ